MCQAGLSWLEGHARAIRQSASTVDTETFSTAAATLEKLLHRGARFPVFYRTFYADKKDKDFCHLPDMDHGGTAMP